MENLYMQSCIAHLPLTLNGDIVRYNKNHNLFYLGNIARKNINEGKRSAFHFSHNIVSLYHKYSNETICNKWNLMLPKFIGCLLSNMQLKTSNTRLDSYLIFKHKDKNVIDIIYKQFKEFILENKQIKLRDNYYYFNSVRLPNFTELYNIWYTKKDKIYPALFIEKHLGKS